MAYLRDVYLNMAGLNYNLKLCSRPTANFLSYFHPFRQLSGPHDSTTIQGLPLDSSGSAAIRQRCQTTYHFHLLSFASRRCELFKDVPVTLFLPVTVTGGIVTIPAGTGILSHAHNSSQRVLKNQYNRLLNVQHSSKFMHCQCRCEETQV